LSADQIVVASAEFVRRMGGDPHIITVFGGSGVDAGALGQRVAAISGLPVWVRGAAGVERLILTRLTEVHGGWGLVVPLVLGGLIIFGTLLGSIADREREIYTFSALGLGPAHVGFLFLAEAGVYATVGGMGGQLLAQLVSRVAFALAERGLIQPPEINFSSTNALFALATVMVTVLISAAYPAVRASRSANPGVARTWKMPEPVGDDWTMTFPFTVSAYDITGVIGFLAEHFREHDDAGLGGFAARDVCIGRDPDAGALKLSAHVALAPFDLGVTQDFRLTAVASEIAGVEEVRIRARRVSGSPADWRRTNRVFVQELRKQFLLWRTLSAETMERYRLQTLQELGESSGQR
ncbi:MAG: ABC transporter permease, partial [Verrucomicrobiae bacterium]|nr:ABC transporter permease [Verrucomicrobiae bacterium]